MQPLSKSSRRSSLKSFLQRIKSCPVVPAVLQALNVQPLFQTRFAIRSAHTNVDLLNFAFCYVFFSLARLLHCNAKQTVTFYRNHQLDSLAKQAAHADNGGNSREVHRIVRSLAPGSRGSHNCIRDGKGDLRTSDDVCNHSFTAYMMPYFNASCASHE